MEIQEVLKKKNDIKTAPETIVFIFILLVLYVEVCVNIPEHLSFFLPVTTCVSFVFAQWPNCDHNPTLGELHTAGLQVTTYSTVSCIASCPRFRYCMSRTSFTLHFRHLLSDSMDWLTPITCCHPVMLPAVFCLAISALPVLTMWPAMYYLEIKRQWFFCINISWICL